MDIDFLAYTCICKCIIKGKPNLSRQLIYNKKAEVREAEVREADW